MMRLIWLIEWIKNRQGFPCLFHLLTGFYCPGCGGTRAIRRLLKGDLAGSFRYHPFVPYLALVLVAELAVFLITAITRNIREKEQKKPEEKSLWIRYFQGMERRYRIWVTMGLIIVIINWFIKNIFLAAGCDLL